MKKSVLLTALVMLAMSVVAKRGGYSGSRSCSSSSRSGRSGYSRSYTSYSRSYGGSYGGYGGYGGSYYGGYGGGIGVVPIVPIVVPVGGAPYGAAYGYGAGYGYNGCSFGCVVNGMCGSADQCAVIRHQQAMRGWIIAGSIIGVFCLICILCICCGACSASRGSNLNDDEYHREDIVEHHESFHSGRRSSYSTDSNGKGFDYKNQTRANLEPAVVQAGIP